MYTLKETRELLLTRADYIDIIELLSITTEDLVDQFEDRVGDNMAEIQEYLDEFTG